MSGQSAIEWTDCTWNPVTGCDRVSPGCAHCYALDLAAKLKRWGQPRYQHDGGKASGPGFGVTLHPDKLTEPLRWRKPRMVFVNSMSDLFHEQVPDEFIAEVFSTMANCYEHTFQVLTKRPERMHRFVRRLSWSHPVETSERRWRAFLSPDDGWSKIDQPSSPLPNVWLGVTIENRRFVHRADLLRDTPAAVRFISAEPLLGPLVAPTHDPNDLMAALEASLDLKPWLDLAGIDWLIIGGESGPQHRRFDPQWARDLIDACRQVGTAPFVKQLGGSKPGNRLEDLPADLRVREWPRQAVRA